MKKGIEVNSEYDANGRWCLHISKKRGKLTLEEIKDAAREWEWDFYLLVLDCYHDEADNEQFGDTPVGDHAVLYRTDLFFKEGER